MALVDYSSSESEEEWSNKPNPVLPSFSCDIEGDSVRFMESEKASNPDGRVRGFSHQHGNWATSVYIPAPDPLIQFLMALLNNITSILTEGREEFKTCDDFHLSLSRTWPIFHHWIAGFESELRSIAIRHPRPRIRLDKAEFLVNDDRTRSFLVVCAEKTDLLVDLLNEIDPLVVSYRGQPYYKEKIFHFSLSWCLGDICKTKSTDWKDACLAAVNDFLSSNSPSEGFELTTLVLKTGDKVRQFPFCDSS